MPIPNVSPTGVTAIEAMVGAATVRVVDAEIPAKLAEILVDPAATEFARPERLMVAVAVDDELQVTRAVRSALLPSL
jgi:hypothetical protein